MCTHTCAHTKITLSLISVTEMKEEPNSLPPQRSVLRKKKIYIYMLEVSLTVAWHFKKLWEKREQLLEVILPLLI